MHSKYRPDIDGLRAVAIILVLAFHAFSDTVSGGFVGVDVFFVISGFLITGIIRSNPTFTIAWFYERRIRRIFPALIVVLLATYAGGSLLLLPPDFAQLGINTIAGSLFGANIALLTQAGYFDLEATRKPLLHLWSLGIEEQFYIAWPLLLLAARRRAGALTLLFAVASFALDLWLMSQGQRDAAFYLPFSRAWELLIGAALTFVEPGRLGRSNPLAIAGALLIATAAVKAKAETFPGWWAAVPTIGAAALIISQRSIVNRWLLGNRLSVAIGKISYPLYLWHWPLLVYGAIMIRPLDDISRAWLIALAIVLATLTWWLVETPIRTGARGGVKVAVLSASMAAIVAAGVLAFRTDGLPQRYPRDVRTVLQTVVDPARWRRGTCMLVDGGREFADSCMDQKRPLLFLWGDSTAAALSPGILDLQKQRVFGFAQYTISSCEPVFGPAVTPYCNDMNRKVLEVLETARPEVVLLEAIWYPTPEHLDALTETIAQLRSIGVPRVVVLGRVPFWKDGLARPAVDFYQTHARRLPDRLPQLASEKWYDHPMRDKVEAAGGVFVSVWDQFCDERQGCLVRAPDIDGKMRLTTADQIHLTDAGSHFLIAKIQDALFPD